MYIQIDYTLFYDPQAAMPASFCLACGCERYAPGLHCLRCERRISRDPDGAERRL